MYATYFIVLFGIICSIAAMYYSTPTVIWTQIGNNTFAYDERIAAFGKAEITVPALIDGTLDDIQIWETITFAELEHNQAKLFYGLQNIVHIQWTNIYIMDNHNHALYCRYKALHDGVIIKWLPVIHIDQHSDLWEAPSLIDRSKEKDLDYIAHYVNEICNVGNFIKPAIISGLISECTQLRTEESLLDFEPNRPYILDVDIDFRVPEMSLRDIPATIEKTKNLLRGASLVTIATSPYFIDQEKAIEIIHQILT